MRTHIFELFIKSVALVSEVTQGGRGRGRPGRGAGGRGRPQRGQGHGGQPLPGGCGGRGQVVTLESLQGSDARVLGVVARVALVIVVVIPPVGSPEPEEW